MDRQFSFKETAKSEINLEILSLESSRSCQELDLPTKIIKANSDIFTEVVHKDLKRSLETGNFPCTIKLAYNVDQGHMFGTFPANIRLDEDVFIFRRCLQDVLIKTKIFAYLIRLQKTSWWRPNNCLGHTSSRRLEDVFKTSSRRPLAKISSRCFQDVSSS